MKIFEGILLNSIYLLFPLLVYLLVVICVRNIDKKAKKLLLETALFSSLYLLFKYGKNSSLIYPMIVFNVLLLLSYLKKKNITAIIMSIFLVIYYKNTTPLSYFILIVEYTMYFLICNYITHRRKASKIAMITVFVIIKSFTLSMQTFLMFNDKSDIVNNFIDLFITMTIFTFIAYLCLYIITKGEDIIDLNKITTELEKEKSLRESLFKITHEIKNPIAVCKGYLDMIDYDDKKKVEKYIPIIKDQISRTLILMDDFLDYTKVKINKEEVDLYMLLEDSCDVSEPLFKKAGIKVEFEIPDDEIYMELDYNRMKQVLVNIFKNSIEAKDKKKKYKFINIDVINGRNDVTIKIKDNGIGMDKKTLSKVDEMFYTTKEKGTGLGVALSKEIIELHGGSMKYTSQIGKYTQVTIKLPHKKER